jgi:hypothetical protein
VSVVITRHWQLELTLITATTMADVLARLVAEEHAQVVREGTSALVVKPGPFLIAGIQIQEDQ